MPRPRRLDHCGARHHVMNRFAEQAPRFDIPGARELFVDTLAEVPERFAVEVHGYAIMSNHYHLMLHTPRGNLSATMQHLGATFTRRYRRAFGGDGPLFRSRFRNELVDSERYWMQLLVYLHLNPVRAGIVASAQHSAWTSHRPYLGLSPRPHWLTTAELLGLFGSARSLDALVAEPDSDAHAVTHEGHVSLPRPDIRRLTRHDALRQVAEATGVENPLRRVPGARPSSSRRLAAWWLWRATDLSLVSIGDVLDVSRARAGQLVQACQDQAESDEELAFAMKRLLFPGQERGRLAG